MKVRDGHLLGVIQILEPTAILDGCADSVNARKCLVLPIAARAFFVWKVYQSPGVYVALPILETEVLNRVCTFHERNNRAHSYRGRPILAQPL